MEPARVLHAAASTPGRAFWGPGDEYTFLVTSAESGGSMFSVDCRVGAGGGPPPHRHLVEDELFFIYEGAIEFTADGETRTVGAGQSVFVARGVVHAYRNEADTDARMVAVYTPAGMEGWFREVCTPIDEHAAEAPPITPELIERMLEAGPRHNVEWAL